MLRAGAGGAPQLGRGGGRLGFHRRSSGGDQAQFVKVRSTPEKVTSVGHKWGPPAPKCEGRGRVGVAGGWWVATSGGGT